MKNTFSFLLAVMLCSGAAAQQLVINSTTYYGGTDDESINRVIPTADGGFLAVGAASTTDGHFPPPPGGGRRCLVAKHDSTGALQWAKRYGSSSVFETARCATQTPDGGFVIGCAYSFSGGDVPSVIGIDPSTYDAWVFKVDAAGSLLWSKSYGSSSNDLISDILSTPDGGLLTLVASGGSDSDATGAYAGGDWMLIKTDGQGNRQWRRMIGGDDYEGESSYLFNAPGGGYYLVGNSLSHDSDLTEDNLWPGGVAPQRGPVFMRLSDSGQVQWCKRYGGSGPTVSWDALLDITDTSLVAAGYTKSNDFHFTGNHLNVANQPTYDMFLVKVDKNGELIFSKLLGTSSDDECNALAKRSDGTYLLGGFMSSPSPYGGDDIAAVQASATGDSLARLVAGAAGRDRLDGLIVSGSRMLAVGFTANPPFTNGGTTGPGSNPQGNVFVSRMELWPAAVRTVAGPEPALTIVPNPARGEAECILPKPTTGTLEVVAPDGKVVVRQSFKRERRLVIALDGLPAGVYTVTIRDTKTGDDRSARLVTL